MAKNNKLGMYIGIIAVVLLVGALIGIVNLPTFNVTGETPVKEGQTPTDFAACNTATSTSATFTILDAYGNDITSDYNLALSINGNDVSAQQAAGTAIALSPNDVVEYKAVNASGSHNVYGFSGTYTAPCKTVDKVTLKTGMQDTAVSASQYSISAGSDVANSGASPVAIGAGATAKAKLFLAATTNDGVWSTIQEGRTVGIAIDYNSLVYKQPSITSVDKGTAQLMTGVPNGHVFASGTNATVFYEIKSDALVDLGDLTIKYEAQALTGTTNPTVDDGNISVTVYDKEMYQRLDRTWAVGYRNADTAADLGESNVTSVFYVE